ncbi:MAG: hypothetical protein M0Z56_01820, partial [Desulfobacteraceae bacterium]|nr:hypothetical protein [Desulfobacteraceae bacterium]
MTNSLTMEKTINILGAMVAAINNIRLYPPTSAIILNSIDKAYSAVKSVITTNQPLLIAESENNLLISGEPLSFKMQQFPQVSSFRSVMTSLRIRSIILKKEMEKGEFKNFLMVISKSADDVELEGGIQKVAGKTKLSHISITPSRHAPEEKAKKTPDSLDVADVDMIRSFIDERKITERNYMRLGEKAVDSKWVTDFFKATIAQIRDQGITIADDLLPDTISRMVQAFARSTPRENWSRISKSITNALSDNEKELFAVVMVKNLEGGLFDTLIKSLSDDQFIDFFADINHINETHSYGSKNLPDDEVKTFSKALTTLKNNKKAQKLKAEIKARIFEGKKKDAIGKAVLNVALTKILKGDLLVLSDKRILDVIPGVITKYYAEDKGDSAMNIINRIADGLLHESLKVRALSSSALLAIGEMFIRENRRDEISKLAHRLNIWVKFETEVTYNFKAVCQLLQNHTRDLLAHYQFSEANTILETFSFIYHGQIRKPDEIREVAGNVLKNIATAKIFNAVFDEFISNGKDEGKNAYYTLIRLGMISVVPLLDLLKTSEDMSQRVRIINAITEIGTPALPVVLERIQVGTAWFYMRNLLKLLSGMGTAEHLDVLKPLINLPNEKIPKAVLNCAFDIGGEDRLKFFIQALNVTSDSVKSVAASLIGKLDNAEEGVFPLTQLLKEKAAGPTEAKNALDIAICGSLKRIGSKKAIPALKAVSTAKG